MPKLNVVTQVTAVVDDAGLQKAPDWKCSTGEVVGEVLTQRVALAPGASVVPFSDAGRSVLATPSDVLACSIALHPSKTDVIQVRSANAFAAISAAAGVAGEVAVISNGDGTLTVPKTAFIAPVLGMRCYFPGSQYGDTGPWSPSNQGFWDVIGIASTNVTLRRTATDVQSLGASETVTLAAATDIQATVASTRPTALYLVLDGYSGIWEVADVSKDYIGLVAPGRAVVEKDANATLLVLATNWASYVRVEANRQVKVTALSGDVAGVIPLCPVTDGDPKAPGWFEQRGFITDLAVQNLSDQPAVVVVIAAFEA